MSSTATENNANRFARVPPWAAGAGISLRALRVLIAIGGHINRDGWAYPSLVTIASLTGIARNNIPRVIRELEDVGLLHRDRSTGGRGNSTRYRVVFKGPETSAPQHTFSPETASPTMLFPDETVPSGDAVSPPKQPQTASPVMPEQKEERRERAKARSLSRAPMRDGWFMDFWKACPSRDGENPKQPARKAFEAALGRGADPVEIVRGAANYALSVANIDNRRFVTQAVTWLKQERWKDHQQPPEPAPAPRRHRGIF
jgi:hypothetical protein